MARDKDTDTTEILIDSGYLKIVPKSSVPEVLTPEEAESSYTLIDAQELQSAIAKINRDLLMKFNGKNTVRVYLGGIDVRNRTRLQEILETSGWDVDWKNITTGTEKGMHVTLTRPIVQER